LNHATNCKFCHRPITVEIDDDYAKLGDPYKLIEKSCCNQCADVRVAKRVLEERISRVATEFAAVHNPSDGVKMLTRKKLTRLIEAYARTIARWHRVDGMAFDAACIDDVMNRPDKWAVVLSGLWKMFREWQHQQQQKELEV